MKKIIISSLIASIIVLTPVYARASTVDQFHTEINGNQEVPQVSTNTTGSLKLIADNTNDEITYILTVQKAHEVTAAHLHCAPVGQNGPVVAFLFGKGGSNVSGQLITSGTLSSLEATAATCSPAITNMSQLILAIHDGMIYANVHSKAHPAGEIRGQLSSIGSDHEDDQSGVGLDDLFEDLDGLDERLNQQIHEQQQRIFDDVFGGSS